eukprot:scaffold134689_cov27-Tisochrysis_lutea.AAC.1
MAAACAAASSGDSGGFLAAATGRSSGIGKDAASGGARRAGDEGSRDGARHHGVILCLRWAPGERDPARPLALLGVPLDLDFVADLNRRCTNLFVLLQHVLVEHGERELRHLWLLHIEEEALASVGPLCRSARCAARLLARPAGARAREIGGTPKADRPLLGRLLQLLLVHREEDVWVDAASSEETLWVVQVELLGRR